MSRQTGLLPLLTVSLLSSCATPRPDVGHYGVIGDLPGSWAMIYSSGSDASRVVPLFASQYGYCQWHYAMSIRDDWRIHELATVQGEIRWVAVPATVKITDSVDTRTYDGGYQTIRKVKVLDGSDMGQVGWVPWDWIVFVP